MDQKISDALMKAKNILDDSFYNDRKRIENIMSDILKNKFKGECSVLMTVFSEGIHKKILTNNEYNIQNVKNDAKYISKRYFINHDIIEDAIRVWYNIINNFSLPENTKEEKSINIKSKINCDPDECYRLALQHYSSKFGLDNDYKEAKKYFKKSAEFGNIDAQYYLGLCYEEGTGTQKNSKLAFSWYLKAAEAGNDKAIEKIVYCYKNGYGTVKNNKEYARWFKKYIENCSPEQQYLIAEDYANGNYSKGISKEPNTAISLYKKAADSDYVPAQIKLADCYFYGINIQQNYNNAVYWYRKAAELGDTIAQTCLGARYELGQGVTQDDTQAVIWYKKAADKGYAQAQTNLGKCYYSGNGVHKDYKECVLWLSKAARQGNAEGQNWLGVRYELGEGIKQDYYHASSKKPSFVLLQWSWCFKRLYSSCILV